MALWNEEKSKYLNMPLEEKRTYYKKKHQTVDDIQTWKQYAETGNLNKIIPMLPANKIDSSKNKVLAEKISLFDGDITTLEIDCIVNAANKSLRGGGGVDGAIHRVAGPDLVNECTTLHGCEVGEAKMTGGYKLPAKYVIHTVGPQDKNSESLSNCYKNCLKVMATNGLKSIAFPCISTGIYGFPREPAAHIAAYEVRKFLESNDKIDRIIFCIFLPEDMKIYEGVLQSYFPIK